MAYFREILSVSRSILKGMGITWRYLVNPKRIVTIQYPREHAVIPSRHRGTHFLETEKCILCYQCANACPVDCIYIEGSRDGAIDGCYQGKGAVVTRFSIDYGLCIYCNLCCEPCPTECIHMGQQFNLVSTTRDDMMNNLLTDKPFNAEDMAFVVEKRTDIERLAEEKKKAKEAKAKAAAAAKAKAAAAAKAKAAAEAKTESKPDAKADAKPETKPETKPDAKANAKPDAKAETKPDAKAETKADAMAETKADAKPGADAKAEPQTDAKSGADAKPEADAEPKSAPAPEAKKAPEPPSAAGGAGPGKDDEGSGKKD